MRKQDMGNDRVQKAEKYTGSFLKGLFYVNFRETVTETGHKKAWINADF